MAPAQSRSHHNSNSRNKKLRSRSTLSTETIDADLTWQQNLLETHTLVTLLIGIAAIALILTGDKTDALMLLTVLVGYALGASAHIVTATASRLLTNQTVKLSSAS